MLALGHLWTNFMQDMTKFYSLIPVWMILMFTQGHRDMGKLEPVQSFCWKVAWSNSNVHDGWYVREMIVINVKKSCMANMDHVSICSSCSVLGWTNIGVYVVMSVYCHMNLNIRSVGGAFCVVNVRSVCDAWVFRMFGQYVALWLLSLQNVWSVCGTSSLQNFRSVYGAWVFRIYKTNMWCFDTLEC